MPSYVRTTSERGRRRNERDRRGRRRARWRRRRSRKRRIRLWWGSGGSSEGRRGGDESWRNDVRTRRLKITGGRRRNVRLDDEPRKDGSGQIEERLRYRRGSGRLIHGIDG
jgi:hypothetical protein